MSRVKFTSVGPMLIVIDSKTKPDHLLISNPSLVMTVALQIQIYGESAFQVRPKLALIPVRGTVDIEMFGDKAEFQSFHIVATHWPYGKNQFDKTTWMMLEKKYKEKFQIVSFGRPPKYSGLKDIPGESTKSAASASAPTASSGPKLLEAHIPCISFKPPTGSAQTSVIKLKNLSSTKPTAFKLMVNRGPYYIIRPGKGILDVSKEVKIEVEMSTTYTKKDFEKDNQGHEIHIFGIKWPKKFEEYHHDEWARLEKARKDQKQRLVISINHKGQENAPLDGPPKTSEQLSSGPALVEIVPKKLLLTPPLTKSQTVTLKNIMPGTVAFKLQTNRPSFYVVNPNKGIIKAESKIDSKIDVNENLNVKDFQDAEGHQFLMIAVEWPHGDEFDQVKFVDLMKTKKVVGKLQRQCIDVELEVASKNVYLTCIPQRLSYKLPSAAPQTISVTLVNNSPKPVGFKIVTGHPNMNKFYKVTPEKGRIESTFTAQVNFTLSEKVRETDMPTDPSSHCFKVNAIPWPLPSFNDELWQEYEGFKKGEMQIMRLRADFDGLDQNVSAGGQMGADKEAEAMMMAMMMQQMQQMQGMNNMMMGGMMAQPNLIFSDPEIPQDEEESTSQKSTSEKSSSEKSSSEKSSKKAKKKAKSKK